MPEFAYRGSVEHVDHEKNCAILRKQMFSPIIRHGYFIAGAGFFGTFAASKLMAQHIGIYMPAWILYSLLFVFAFGFFYVSSHQSKRMWETMKANPTRKGEVSYQASPEGLTYRSNFSHGHIQWGGFIRVVDTPDSVLLLIGELEYLPLPSEFFVDEGQRAQFISEVQRWIDLANSVPASTNADQI